MIALFTWFMDFFHNQLSVFTDSWPLRALTTISAAGTNLIVLLMGLVSSIVYLVCLGKCAIMCHSAQHSDGLVLTPEKCRTLKYTLIFLGALKMLAILFLIIEGYQLAAAIATGFAATTTLAYVFALRRRVQHIVSKHYVPVKLIGGASAENFSSEKTGIFDDKRSAQVRHSTKQIQEALESTKTAVAARCTTFCEKHANAG